MLKELKIYMPFSHSTSKPVKSLRSYLIRLVLFAVIPLLFFFIALVFYVSRQQNLELENSLSSRAQSVQAVIDDKLSSVLSSLKILAVTEEFLFSEFPLMHTKLARASKNMEGWEAIVITDLMGNVLLHTSHPYGTKLKPYTTEPFFKKVIKTKRPVFSDLRFGTNSKKDLISIAIPIFHKRIPTHILIGHINYEVLIQTLRSLGLSEDWNAAVIDNNLRIVARSRMPEKYVGTRVSDALIEHFKDSKKGVFESNNKEGVPSYSVFTRSPLTNWIVVLGFPIANLSKYLDLSRVALILAIFIILIGIFLAIKIGSKISDPIVALSQSAEAFGKGLDTTPIESAVEEIDVLARSLELASAERLNSENAIRTIHEISSSLSAELDLKKLLQSFTDQATILTRAEFGAYFDTSKNQSSEFFDIVTLSGAPMEKFSQFPLPRYTDLFGPTFRGEGIIRLDDVTKDSRFGNNTPYNGLPQGHLPVKSYLAIPVISRTGEVIGGLFFGHSTASIFTEQDATLVSALAAQAAIAIDNASLYSKATQAIEHRDSFLSVASHELKTPLTSIYLQFEVLKRTTLKATVNDPKMLQLFERFQSQLVRLTRLINELLDVTQITSGKMNFHLESIELNKLVQDISTSFENEAVQKGSPIKFTPTEPLVGQWDSGRIEQVFTNLVSNAIKYGNSRPIEIKTLREDKWAVVYIKDNGLGIAPEDQARIFQRFERAIDSNSISGLGLGLFICSEIIIRHGGEITVESKINEGSTFKVKLPL